MLSFHFELEGQHFFGYNLSNYYGKINGKIKFLLIPIRILEFKIINIINN